VLIEEMPPQIYNINAVSKTFQKWSPGRGVHMAFSAGGAEFEVTPLIVLRMYFQIFKQSIYSFIWLYLYSCSFAQNAVASLWRICTKQDYKITDNDKHSYRWQIARRV